MKGDNRRSGPKGSSQKPTRRAVAGQRCWAVSLSWPWQYSRTPFFCQIFNWKTYQGVFSTFRAVFCYMKFSPCFGDKGPEFEARRQLIFFIDFCCLLLISVEWAALAVLALEFPQLLTRKNTTLLNLNNWRWWALRIEQQTSRSSNEHKAMSKLLLTDYWRDHDKCNSSYLDISFKNFKKENIIL